MSDPGQDNVSDFTDVEDGDTLIVVPGVGFGEGGFGGGGFGGVTITLSVGFGTTTWTDITTP